MVGCRTRRRSWHRTSIRRSSRAWAHPGLSFAGAGRRRRWCRRLCTPQLDVACARFPTAVRMDSGSWPTYCPHALVFGHLRASCRHAAVCPGSRCLPVEPALVKCRTVAPSPPCRRPRPWPLEIGWIARGGRRFRQVIARPRRTTPSHALAASDFRRRSIPRARPRLKCPQFTPHRVPSDMPLFEALQARQPPMKLAQQINRLADGHAKQRPAQLVARPVEYGLIRPRAASGSPLLRSAAAHADLPGPCRFCQPTPCSTALPALPLEPRRRTAKFEGHATNRST